MEGLDEALGGFEDGSLVGFGIGGAGVAGREAEESDRQEKGGGNAMLHGQTPILLSFPRGASDADGMFDPSAGWRCERDQAGLVFAGSPADRLS
jgi:hypothetical protein